MAGRWGMRWATSDELRLVIVRVWRARLFGGKGGVTGQWIKNQREEGERGDGKNPVGNWGDDRGKRGGGNGERRIGRWGKARLRVERKIGIGIGMTGLPEGGWEGDRVAMVGRRGEKLVERRRMMTVEQLGGDGTKAWWHWQPEQRTDMIGRQRGAETQWRQRWSWRWQHRSAAAVAMATTTAIATTIMV